MKALGIDIGTSSISFVILDTKLSKVIFSKTIKNDTFIKTGYTYEKAQDANHIIDKVLKSLNEVINEEKIEYIGLTGQMHGILYINEAGEAISPLYTWQDGSGDEIMPPKSESIQKKNEAIPKKNDDGVLTYAACLSEITGYHMASGFGAATYYVHMMQKRVPKTAKKICTIMDYLGMKLTGNTVPIIDSTNAASLGLYDIKGMCFDKEAIEKAGLSYSFFPEEDLECNILGCTKSGIPVGIAIGDNQASFLGAVNDTDKTILVNIGTGGQICFVMPEYIQGEGFEVRPFIGNKFLFVKSSLCGGRAYALLENLFENIITGYAEFTGVRKETSKDRIYSWMDSVLSEFIAAHENPNNVSKNVPVTSPLFSGTRENPSLRASISNIDTDNFTPANLIYSLLNGMVEELCNAYDLCKSSSDYKPEVLVGSGNGIRYNSHLRSLFEKRLQMPMRISENEEEAACGAALNGINNLL